MTLPTMQSPEFLTQSSQSVSESRVESNRDTTSSTPPITSTTTPESDEMKDTTYSTPTNMKTPSTSTTTGGTFVPCSIRHVSRKKIAQIKRKRKETLQSLVACGLSDTPFGKNKNEDGDSLHYDIDKDQAFIKRRIEKLQEDVQLFSFPASIPQNQCMMSDTFIKEFFDSNSFSPHFSVTENRNSMEKNVTIKEG